MGSLTIPLNRTTHRIHLTVDLGHSLYTVFFSQPVQFHPGSTGGPSKCFSQFLPIQSILRVKEKPGKKLARVCDVISKSGVVLIPEGYYSGKKMSSRLSKTPFEHLQAFFKSLRVSRFLHFSSHCKVP
jgi:hypothetical protein